MTAATRPGQVLAIVCAGIVLANLDLFIVNVALPNIAQELNDAESGELVLDPQRLCHRLRGVAGVLWEAGRTLPAKQQFPRGHRPVHRRVGRLRPRKQCRNPGRVPSRAGGRGGIAHPDLAGADPGDLPGRAPRRRGPRLGGSRRIRRRSRTFGRRIARHGQLAVDLSGQRADWPSRIDGGLDQAPQGFRPRRSNSAFCGRPP